MMKILTQRKTEKSVRDGFSCIIIQNYQLGFIPTAVNYVFKLLRP